MSNKHYLGNMGKIAADCCIAHPFGGSIHLNSCQNSLHPCLWNTSITEEHLCLCRKCFCDATLANGRLFLARMSTRGQSRARGTIKFFILWALPTETGRSQVNSITLFMSCFPAITQVELTSNVSRDGRPECKCSQSTEGFVVGLFAQQYLSHLS